jgi:hypothetical protein
VRVQRGARSLFFVATLQTAYRSLCLDRFASLDAAARRASRPRLSHLLDDIVAMKTKKIFGILAAITFVVLLCKVFFPEWIVSGFHIG